MIERINIYCTNFERSIRILQDVGLQVIRDLGEGTMKKIMPGLRMPPEAMLRAVLMIFGDNPCSTRIDLIQWKGPDTEGQAHQHLWPAGMCRIALHPHAMKDYEDLKTKGIQFWTEPILIKTEQQ